jgi:hypothetical protein
VCAFQKKTASKILLTLGRDLEPAVLLEAPFEFRETPSTVVNYSYYCAAEIQFDALGIA